LPGSGKDHAKNQTDRDHEQPQSNMGIVPIIVEIEEAALLASSL
jgi:hypothetical protein